MSWKRNYVVIMAASLMLAACGGDEGDSNKTLPTIDNTPQETAKLGASSFVSADGYEGQATRENTDGNNANNAEPAANDEFGADADGADDRTVEEGDIYRVTTTGHVLNLNTYRGLQIIDFSDATSPEIVGNVQVSGTPVEMYQVGTRVFMLLNNWQGYYGSRSDILADSYYGGLVMVVDISNPALPKVTGRAQVPGWIRSSRLTRGNDKEALFVVAQNWNDSGQETKVKSFSVSSLGKLDAKTEINLGGYVTDIQATPERLLVARHNWNGNNQHGSDVSVIDITDPNGTMVEGASVRVQGYVNNKYNMDVHNDILRVVSGNSWSSATNTNHVETFDATNINNLTPIDSATFGDNEDLFATLFMGESAFFVTYRRVDPFHAFEITNTGQITEKSEFIVSGWNDYFRPVAQQTRLVGIGKNDENGGNTMAVSLYDVTDLTNPSPLIAREEVELNSSWSEASWDDRAFTVLEKGTNVMAADGTIETGLVLLPYSGWDDVNKDYISAVQIFTFSNSTLTRRGTMSHDTQVRRSFVADLADNTTGNLSEMELSFYNTTNPDSPAKLGSVELATSYTDIMAFGNYGLRRHDRQGYYWWWRPSSGSDPMDDLEVFDLSLDPDKAPTLATIPVPTNASITQVGDRLVITDTRPTTQNYDDFETEVTVWDLSNPGMPVPKGNETYELPLRSYGYYYWDDCFDCSYYWGGYYNNAAMGVGDKLVVPEMHYEQELVGTRTQKYTRPVYNERRWEQCYDQQNGGYKACSYIEGGISCSQLTRLDGTKEAEYCSGEIYSCTQDADGERDCTKVEPSTVATETEVYENEQYRGWQWYSFHIIDVSGDSLGAKTVIDMATDEEASGLLPKGDSLFVSFKKPVRVAGDSRPFVAYYMQELDLSSTASMGPQINIPGTLLDVDGTTVVTRDLLYGQNIIETSLNKLQIRNNRAFLRGVQRFVDQDVNQVILDGAGSALVTHREAYLVNRETYGRYNYDEWDRTVRLSILDAASNNFAKISQTDIDDWANLQGAIAGRALFTVPGGVLVMKTSDRANPTAHAYYPMRGWAQNVELVGGDLYMAAGPYGLYKLSANAPSNLLTP